MYVPRLAAVLGPGYVRRHLPGDSSSRAVGGREFDPERKYEQMPFQIKAGVLSTGAPRTAASNFFGTGGDFPVAWIFTMCRSRIRDIF